MFDFSGSVSAPYCRPPRSGHMTSLYSSTSSCSSSTARPPTQRFSLTSLTLRSSLLSLSREASLTPRTLPSLSLTSVLKRYMCMFKVPLYTILDVYMYLCIILYATVCLILVTDSSESSCPATGRRSHCQPVGSFLAFHLSLYLFLSPSPSLQPFRSSHGCCPASR